LAEIGCLVWVSAQVLKEASVSAHISRVVALPQFAVFFADGAGFGIEMVQALDTAHAQDIARAQHPTGRLSAMPAELLEGQDRHDLLRAWLNGE
jgi:hypothetical protein